MRVPSSDAIARAKFLGGRVNGHPEHCAECVPELVDMLSQHDDPDVLVAIVHGLGHAWTEDACLAVVPLARSEAPEVRRAAAMAMPGGVESGGAVSVVARTLMTLLDDDDEDVRDWAAFGLGTVLEVDSVEVRDALFSRIGDPHLATRWEALVGLAKRRDARALEFTVAALRDEWVARLAVEAAMELGDSRCLSALEALTRWWDVDPALLRKAIAACSTP